jgi:hypothetical protein
MKIIKTVLAVSAILLLNGCGGGGSSGDNPSAVVNATFDNAIYDNAVFPLEASSGTFGTTTFN